MKTSLILGLVIWFSLGTGLGSAGTLTSVKVATAPVMDGTPEAIWGQAPAMTVNVAGGANAGSHTVTLKSIYTDDSVYFLATWNDPTESLRRTPWVKQADGIWKQLKDPDDKGHDNNKYYEDKLAQIRNINTPAFDTSGCFATCHAGEPGKAYGNKYTANPGETADIWHMKMVRTNPVGYVDDQYLDSTRYDKDKAPEAGRKSDPGSSAYSTNANKTVPAYTSATQPAQTNKAYWIFDDQKQAFEDKYKTNDEIAGIIVKTPTGDRAYIMGKAVYADGKWTMEYGRKLTTGSQYDVQFSNLKKEYSVGTSIFDNAQVRHSYESGVSKLVFAAPAPTTPAPTATPKGICGPSAILAMAVLPVAIYGLFRRRK